MAEAEGGVSNAEIIYRINELRQDLREMRSTAVQVSQWEDWRRDNYGHRVERIEQDIAKFGDRLDKLDEEVDRRFADLAEESAKRYRTAVNTALTSLVFPIVVAFAVGLFQLVSKS